MTRSEAMAAAGWHHADECLPPTGPRPTPKGISSSWDVLITDGRSIEMGYLVVRGRPPANGKGSHRLEPEWAFPALLFGRSRLSGINLSLTWWRDPTQLLPRPRAIPTPTASDCQDTTATDTT